MLNLNHRAAFFIEGLAECVDLASMVASYRELLEACGYDHFIMSGLPTHASHARELIAEATWPDGWTDRFIEQRYFEDDPVCVAAMRTSRPFDWAEARAAQPRTERTRTIEGEAAEFGLRNGFVMPLCSNSSWQTVISVASSEKGRLDVEDQGQLYLASAHFWGAVEEVLERRRERPRLSRREAEVLELAAAGKTMIEIGMIVDRSPKTIEHHLRRIREKYDVVTTVQAVARGIADQAIRP